MTIEKRNITKYIFLNCITLGVYGYVVSRKIGTEINTLCKGDGEETRLGYTEAIMIRAIPAFLGMIIGAILAVVSASDGLLYYFDSGAVTAIALFLGLSIGSIAGMLLGNFISSIYLNYWWYRQSGRMRLNAGRYGLVVHEGGADTYILRAPMSILFFPLTIIMYVLSALLPMIVIGLLVMTGNTGAFVFASILLFITVLLLIIFGAELSVGSNISMGFIFKTLNRYSDVCKNGALSFEPMAYEYYPSVYNDYINIYSNIVNIGAGRSIDIENKSKETEIKFDNEMTAQLEKGHIKGLSGTCAGYDIELEDGETIIIGKDAAESNILIDTAYKKVSRKHVSITYYALLAQYHVVDYSSNGTWADGRRLIKGENTILNKGTIIKVVDDKNEFRLS